MGGRPLRRLGAAVVRACGVVRRGPLWRAGVEGRRAPAGGEEGGEEGENEGEEAESRGWHRWGFPVVAVGVQPVYTRRVLRQGQPEARGCPRP